MKVRARKQMVLLDISEHVSKTKTTESGLIIQRSTKGMVEDEMLHGVQLNGAIVESVGDETRDINVGDQVLLPAKRGIIQGRLKDGERTLVWINQSDILAVVEKG